jgi:Tol biopolymer transport system component
MAAAPKPLSRLFFWIVVGLFAVTLLAVLLLRPKAEQHLLQVEISAPPGQTFGTTSLSRYAISPDGTKVAFIATAADGKRSLWIRPLDGPAAIRLSGTEGAIGPFWDPTSHWIAFGANGKLQKIEVTGSQLQTLCDASIGGFGGTWNRDGVILFSDARRIIRRVSAAGGPAVVVLPLDESRKENGQIDPQFLPDGRRFLYSSLAQQAGVVLGSLDGKSRLLMRITNAFPLGSYAASQDGKAYLLFLRSGQLMAQPFDAGAAVLSGEPVPIAEPLQTGGPSFSVSENGVLIFRRSQGGRQLTWSDRDGKRLGTAGDAGNIFSPRISPDQKSVVFFQSGGISPNIWLFDRERGNSTPFTLGPEAAMYPIWSPGGSGIAYMVRRPNETLVVERPAGGMGNETVLYRSADSIGYAPGGWLPDGRGMVLLNLSSGAFSLLPIGAAGSGGERKLIPFPESPVEGRHPSLSPDGQWLLYSSIQTGGREVFVESVPEQMGGPAIGKKMQVSIAGGTQPSWSADGKEIFYIAADSKMMSVSFDSHPASVKLGVPKPLFQIRAEFDIAARQYDVSADGKRFLLAQPLEESVSVPITVIVNWPELLKKGSLAP